MAGPAVASAEVRHLLLLLLLGLAVLPQVTTAKSSNGRLQLYLLLNALLVRNMHYGATVQAVHGLLARRLVVEITRQRRVRR